MTTKQIRQSKLKLFKVLEDANKELGELRKNCPHKNEEKCLYMWRVGNIQDSIICADCGKYLRPAIQYFTTQLGSEFHATQANYNFAKLSVPN